MHCIIEIKYIRGFCDDNSWIRERIRVTSITTAAPENYMDSKSTANGDSNHEGDGKPILRRPVLFFDIDNCVGGYPVR